MLYLIKKGNIKQKIFGNKKEGIEYIDMLEYAVNVERDSTKKLKFPIFYSGKKDINVIEPIYDNLKYG